MKNEGQYLGSSKGCCNRCPAARIGVCINLSSTDQSALVAQSSQYFFKSGATITGQDCLSNYVGIVVSGLVKAVYSTESGSEQLLQVLSTGGVVGDPTGSRSIVSWEAVTDTTLCYLPCRSLKSLSLDHPSLYPSYVKAVVRQAETSQIWRAEISRRGTVQRVAFWLLTQLSQHPQMDQKIINVHLTRRDLASYLLMSPETICRALRTLSKRKAISILSPEQFEVIDIAKLHVEADSEEDRLLRKQDASLSSDHTIDTAV